ncbi:MAG: ATP-dependent DNA helicase RecG [Planctomycetaceae bacterium]|nr:ATP-dependent DNA helicase RecG [Planctomycetaceae bacterium]MCB9951279.1 ATP-dependent DNA helicase RecG [Planctomycetaceae bacterium]
MEEPSLDMHVQFLTGVGPDRAALLARLGIHTVRELLWTLPRDLLDLTEVRQPRDLVAGELQTIRGSVVDIDGRSLGGRKTLTACLLDCGTEYVRAVWFNQPWMKNRLKLGDWVLCSGKPKLSRNRWEFNGPRWQLLSEDETEATGGLVPRYGLTEGLRMGEMQRIVRNAVEQFADLVEDPVPPDLLKRRDYPTLSNALRGVHLPESLDEYQQARERILFDDLLEFQLGLALRRRVWRARKGAPVLEVTAKIDARARRLFPFDFTPGQDMAVREIAADLKSGYAMHRLLQADVGAGKTVVAIYSMLVAVAHGWQAVMMAPTELLAQQHWQTVEQALAGSRVKRALLTGSLSAAERRKTLEQINSGEIDLVVGTQAVIQDAVKFPKLGVAVIDEQHKFGVAQRSTFAANADSSPPHVLVMTATPIPRSLCLTQFGDLDLTVIKDRPQGRQPVMTSRIQSAAAQRKAWSFLQDQLREGRQLYVVCPLVSGKSGEDDELPFAEEFEPDAMSGPQAAEDVVRTLRETTLKNFRVGLVHGQMDRKIRAETMDAFRERELDVLVSTTVIEVGVDVPNATLMVILQAEQFGLSQLHQLRGRVARGRFRSYCFLFSNADSAEANVRLTAMERSDDGFEVAETDFSLRGPGNVLGTRQHGTLPLRVADIVRDSKLLITARDEAFSLVRSGEFDEPKYAALKTTVMERFGDSLDLPRTG